MMRFGFKRKPPTGGPKARAILAALGSRSLVLVGLMGCGKTSVGRRLGAALDTPFVDADEEIEQAAGMTVSEIFTEYGEAHFRDGESKVIARLLQSGPQVLATGGGAFMRADTRATIKSRGISIWLKADLDILMRRVLRRDNRPLLKSPDPRATMARLMAERHPTYAEADLIVESREVSHDEIVAKILDGLLDGPLAPPPHAPADPVAADQP